MNNVTLIGNIGKVEELKLHGDTKIIKCSLATNKKIKGENVTQWHSLVFFNKLAEIVEKYVKKGSKIAVNGEINYNKYEKDGKTMYFTSIVCNNMELLGSKVESNEPVNNEQPEPPIDDLPF